MGPARTISKEWGWTQPEPPKVASMETAASIGWQRAKVQDHEFLLTREASPREPGPTAEPVQRKTLSGPLSRATRAMPSVREKPTYAHWLRGEHLAHTQAMLSGRPRGNSSHRSDRRESDTSGASSTWHGSSVSRSLGGR